MKHDDGLPEAFREFLLWDRGQDQRIAGCMWVRLCI